MLGITKLFQPNATETGLEKAGQWIGFLYNLSSCAVLIATRAGFLVSSLILGLI